MRLYEIAVIGRAVSQNGAETELVRSSVGVDRVHVMFDSAEWADFPVSLTFANGDAVVTAPIILSSVEDTTEWALEATCDVPWEVLQEVGGIRLTFQGTDSGGNHIITEASGTPLTVVEAGEVGEGSVPGSAPTVSEWQQAYADAKAAVNDAASLVENLRDEIDGIVQTAVGSIDATYGQLPIATTEDLGAVMVGDGLAIDEEGVLSADETNGLTTEQASALANLRRLAALAFVSQFDDGGALQAATVAQSALPIATSTTRGTVIPDGESLEVGAGGTLSIAPDYFQEQFGDIEGALKYKGEVQDASSLPSNATTGDMYIVGSSVLFWDGEGWAEVSSEVDLSAYEQSANLSPITAAEVHEVTAQAGSLDTYLYVTRSYLQTALQAQLELMETAIDSRMEALLDASY